MGSGASLGVRLGCMGARHGIEVDMGSGIDMGASVGGDFAGEEDGKC